MKKNTALNFIGTAVLLMVLWFVMSQKTEPKFLIIGAASSVLIAAIANRILTMPGRRSGEPYYVASVDPVKAVSYFFWLLVQIVKSALYVSKVALFRMDELDPSIAWFRADYDSPAARALLANSITLTPGTVTIDISDDGIYSVHALTRELREGLLDGSMQRKIAWLYGEDIDFDVVGTYEVPEEHREEVRFAALRNNVFRRRER